MSGTRFDKWRALAIEAVENDLRERDFALARWGEEVRTGSRLWADYLCDAFDGQTSFGQLLSGAMVLGFWWLKIPGEFLRLLGLGTPPPTPSRPMFLPPVPPAPSPTDPDMRSAGGSTPLVGPAAPPFPDSTIVSHRRVTKAPRKVRAKARRAGVPASRSAARKRSSAG